MPGSDPRLGKIEEIFKGDGCEIQQQIIVAGLLLMIFERFKRYVVENVDGFFSSEIRIEDEKLAITRSKKFKDLVKIKGKGEIGQHRNGDFRAALHWFKDLGAIESGEVEEFERIYNLRNEIGHELLALIIDGNKSAPKITDVVITFGVYVGIVRWWYKEIEVATDPEMTEERYNSIDFSSVETLETMIMREIIHKSLKDNKEWNEFVSSAKNGTGCNL